MEGKPNRTSKNAFPDFSDAHDRTENACTVSTSGCPIQSLRKRLCMGHRKGTYSAQVFRPVMVIRVTIYPTRSKQLSTVAILGFQFRLYHVVAPLSFLRSISLASLFAVLTITLTAFHFLKRIHICYLPAGRSV